MKRILTFLVNWILILSLPIWGGLLALGVLFYEASEGECLERDILKGDEFFF